eukprot:5345778-Alexandrium_andersonii.AAC.1
MAPAPAQAPAVPAPRLPTLISRAQAEAAASAAAAAASTGLPAGLPAGASAVMAAMAPAAPAVAPTAIMQAAPIAFGAGRNTVHALAMRGL